MKCVCHEDTSILDGFSAIWFSFWVALNWIWNSLGLAFGLAFGSIVDYVLNHTTIVSVPVLSVLDEKITPGLEEVMDCRRTSCCPSVKPSAKTWSGSFPVEAREGRKPRNRPNPSWEIHFTKSFLTFRFSTSR